MLLPSHPFPSTQHSGTSSRDKHLLKNRRAGSNLPTGMSAVREEFPSHRSVLSLSGRFLPTGEAAAAAQQWLSHCISECGTTAKTAVIELNVCKLTCQALNQLGSPNIPNPELYWAHQCSGYSSSHIPWARQRAPGSTRATTTTALSAVELITLHALGSCAILVVRDSKGSRVDATEVRLKVS